MIRKYLALARMAPALILCALLVTLTSPALAFTPHALNYTGALTSGHCLTVSVPQTGTLNDGGNCAVALPLNTTWTVCASGCAYVDPVAAQNALQSFLITPGTSLTFSEPCGGSINENNTAWLIDQHAITQWYMRGCAPVAYAFTSIVSTGGVPGAYVITVQASGSVAAIVPSHDWEFINNASGGSFPTAIDGDCAITATNISLNQITLFCKYQYPAGDLPSGAVAGTVWDESSVMSYTNMAAQQAAIGVQNFTNIHFANIAITCDGTCVNDITVQDNSRLYFGGALIVDGAVGGMFDTYNTSMDNTPAANGGLYISGSQAYGLSLQTGAVAFVSPLIVSGTSAGPGIIVDGNGSFIFTFPQSGTLGGLLVGNAGNGLTCENGAGVEWAGASNYNGYTAGVGGAGYGFAQTGVGCTMAAPTATATGNFSGAAYPNPSSISSPALTAGFVVTSGGGCYGDDRLACTSRVSGSNPKVDQSTFGWLFNGGQGLDNDSTYTNYGAGTINTVKQYFLGGLLFGNSSSPTWSSGFGTTPTVCTTCSSNAFFMNVGTGGTATGGVLTMPTPHPSHSWACSVTDTTSSAAIVVISLPTSNASVTFNAFSRTTGASIAFNSGDNLTAQCTPY